MRKLMIAAALLLGAAIVAPALAAEDVINQARAARAITPADNTPLALAPTPTRGIYIGAAAACAIAVILADDTAAVTFTAVPGGTFLPLRAKTVMATNTTCTAIVGLW